MHAQGEHASPMQLTGLNYNPCVNHCAIVENAPFSLDILKPLNKTLILQ